MNVKARVDLRVTKVWHPFLSPRGHTMVRAESVVTGKSVEFEGGPHPPKKGDIVSMTFEWNSNDL